MRPFLHDSARFFTALRAGCQGAGRNLADHRRGRSTPASRRSTRSPVLNDQLPPTADALLAFQQSTGVFNGLDLLIDTNELLEARRSGSSLRRRPPATTSALAFRNLANASGEGNGQGNWLNVDRPSSRRKDRTPRAARPRRRRTATAEQRSANHLHSNPYPNTGAPGQPNECEAGNEQYTLGKTMIGNTPRDDRAQDLRTDQEAAE